MASTSLRALALAAGASIPLIAQSPSRPIEPVVTPIHTAPADPEGGDYGTWAAGRDYKVSFHDGMTFVPYLGPDYRHNQPLSWRTVSVSLGGAELVTTAPRGTRRSGTRYEYDLGGVVEAYDVRLDGLEQTFVIAERPARIGELVVRGEVTTGLVAQNRPAAPGDVVFTDAEGRPILDYGAATAVDAEGATAAMTTQFRDGHLTLRLPAEWLRDAAFPVVVDPLMGNKVVGQWSGTYGSPISSDVIRESESPSRNVWICYTRSASASDEDLWLVRLNDDIYSGSVAIAYQDIASGWSSEDGQVAFMAGADRCVCAFTRDYGSTRNVVWHAHERTDMTVGTTTGRIRGTNNNWRPDIGGTVGGHGATQGFIVFQHEPVTTFAATNNSEIHAAFVNFAAPSGSTSQGIVNRYSRIRVSADNERPRISQEATTLLWGGVPLSWALVYQSYPNSAGSVWHVELTMLVASGPGILPIQVRRFTEHFLGPVVSGMNGRYLLQFAASTSSQVPHKTALDTGHTLECFRFDWNGTTLSFPWGQSTVRTSTQRDLKTGALAYDRNTASHWVSISRADDRILVDTLGHRGGLLRTEPAFAGNSSRFERPGGVSFNHNRNEFVLAYTVGATGWNPVMANIYNYPPTPAPRTAGTSCSGYGLSWLGSQLIGNEYGRVLASASSGTSVSNLHILAISLGPASMSLAGVGGVAPGCHLLVDIARPRYVGLLTGAPFLSGFSWDLPLPEFLDSGRLFFQDFHLGASGTVFETTPRLEVPIVK